MGTVWFQVAVIVVLTVLNGFFAASEIAVVSSRRGRLQQRAENGDRGARIALELAEEPSRFLATVQVGITLISTIAAAFGGNVLSEPLALALAPLVGAGAAQPIAFTLVVLLLTYLSLIIGELVPKRLALQGAESVAATLAPVMQMISVVAAPVVWFLSASTQAVLTLMGRANRPEERVTEDDVLSLVREGAAEGTVEASEQTLIERVFDFTDATARSIMTPRTDIIAVPLDISIEQLIERIINSGYSRIPVFHGTLDTIAGIVHAKDVLAATCKVDDNAAPRLQDLLRSPVYVYEHQRLGAVLQQLKQSRTHLALVLDEYGQVDGLVTVEDVLEELAGDIHDEYDENDPLIVQRSDGSWLVDGRLGYAEAESRLGLPPREQLGDLPPFDTLAGLLLALLEHIPATGESVELGGWQLEVVDMDGHRIDKLLLRRSAEPDSLDQAEASLAVSALLPPPVEPHAKDDPRRNAQGRE